MKYRVQSNWSFPHNEYVWKTICSDRAGHQEYDNLARAITVFERNCDMARCIAPMRVIDDKDCIYAIYEPECDTRLPGPRFRLLQKLAYRLWEEAGHPDNQAELFWHKAERSLPESKGIAK